MNDLLLSLEITGLGMGLVFGAIILLWVMMLLLTAFTGSKKTESDDSPETDAKPVPHAEDKRQAAAIAVAIALAEQGQSTARPLSQPPTALVSAWQLGMRTSQRTQKGSIGRR